MTTGTVGVVVIAKNQEAFVAEAIESVYEQDYEHVRLVFVDDASDDETVVRAMDAIANQQCSAQAMPKSVGPSAARNAGALAVWGHEFLLFLDGDDALHPHFLAETVRALSLDLACDVAYTDADHFGEGRKTYRVDSGAWSPGVLANSNPIPYCSLMRASAFRFVGGYRADEGMMADWGLWRRMARAGIKGVRVPRPLFRYRRHPGQWTATVTREERARLRGLVMQNRVGDSISPPRVSER